MPATLRTRAGADLKHALRSEALRLGFSALGIAAREALRNREPELRRWLEAGFSGPLDYMRRFFERQERFLARWPDLKSVIVLATPYGGHGIPASQETRETGRVARYAVGSDYHAAIKRRLGALAEELRRLAAATPDLRVEQTVDTKPVLERALAEAAGIGFFGKNTCMIRPKGGSYFFISTLLTNLPLEPDAPLAWDCGACTLCLEACPTGALVEPYRLDASRCISTLTIELRGPVPQPMRPLMDNWVFGCDLCQEVCPYNHRRPAGSWPELSSSSGPGAHPPLRDLLSCRTQREFQSKFSPTALSRAKREGLLRNTAIAAGNLRDPALTPALAETLQRDPSPTVRGHAAWALGRLSAPDAVQSLKKAAQAETDPSVLQEIRNALAG